MQIARLRLQNFKGIDNLELSFLKEGTDEPRPVTLLLGDNGAGKTTVLQAIAFVLSLAKAGDTVPNDFSWPGFLVDRISTLGSTRVELVVDFDPDELKAIQYIQQRDRGERFGSSPASRLPRSVTLIYENGHVELASPGMELGRRVELFLARSLVLELFHGQPEQWSLLRRIGDVFWFDQNRNVLALPQLRDSMITLWAAHRSVRRSSVPDYLGEIESRFAELFPGTHFIGVEPRKTSSEFRSSDAYFLLERDGRVYDIAEMSSGEQAIFPLLYSFVLQGISRSVVLIDELELHLHPPQQQSLMAALRRIGPDCQFIVTSHSPYLEQMTPDEDEIRLPGGQRCL